jgi:hypothetical protein
LILNREKGGYLLGQVVRLTGSFTTNGTSDPTVIRDGNSDSVLSVTYVSAGLFTVKFAGAVRVEDQFPIPEKLVGYQVHISQGVAPTSSVRAYLVKNSYSQVTRSFQIQCQDLETPAATNPDTGDWISFELVGCIDQSGTDAA